MELLVRDRRLATTDLSDLTSFVGRRLELAEVRRSLAGTRMLTLTGVGGVGKTRLAIHAARDRVRAFEDGVWLVELAHISDGKRVVDEVAATFGLARYPHEEQHDQLLMHLRDKRLLIVLDNCEHVLSECAALAEMLLTQVGGLKILATSRQPLRIPGERIVQVPPLSLPQATGSIDVATLGQYDAVTLLSDRARAVEQSFALSDHNGGTVAGLCRLLDGIPLAIELAAARLRMMSVDQLFGQLSDRFGLLTYGNRFASPRQQTLQATVDWSFELCTAPERLLWSRLSVFSGGFEIVDVQQICAGAGLDRRQLRGLIEALVDKSIVIRTTTSAEPQRYSLLETIREYGLRHLQAAHDLVRMQRRHCDRFMELTEAAEASPPELEQDAYEALRRNTANLRAALQFGLEDARDGGRLLGFVAALCTPKCMCGSMDDQQRWLEQALSLVPESAPLRTRALWRGAWLCIRRGDVDAARALLADCRAIAEATEDPSASTYASHLTGVADLAEMKFSSAVELLQDAIERHTALGDFSGQYFARAQLLMALSFAGDPKAVPVAEAYLAAARDASLKAFISWLQAVYLVEHGELDGLADRLSSSILSIAAATDRWLPASCVETLAWIVAADGDCISAARIFGRAEKLRRALGFRIRGLPVVAALHDKYAALARRRIGDEAFDREYAHGYEAEDDEAISAAAYGQQEPPSLTHSVADVSTLTRRQLEVAHLVAQGMTNKEIAADLVISQRTAETHVEHILTKLGFTARTQIAAWYTEHGHE